MQVDEKNGNANNYLFFFSWAVSLSMVAIRCLLAS